jgi:hypothetical protein
MKGICCGRSRGVSRDLHGNRFVDLEDAASFDERVGLKQSDDRVRVLRFDDRVPADVDRVVST